MILLYKKKYYILNRKRVLNLVPQQLLTNKEYVAASLFLQMKK